MESTASELMRNYVNSPQFTSTSEIMEAMKGLFRDALQQVMEGELDEQLGYEKNPKNVRKRRKYAAKKLQKWVLTEKRKDSAWQG